MNKYICIPINKSFICIKIFSLVIIRLNLK